ncbi:MAG: FHA domain-containing protein, partial [Candidatus Hydrogenedentes bacterium]|nr:FHA domain-containing protein [Candidatus Hydrogenedentota bacterium]
MCQHAPGLRRGGNDLAIYEAGEKGLVVGRAADCDITLADSLVSRHHARLFTQDNELHIADLGSRNGVFVNGRRVASCRLNENDEVTIGGHSFVVAQPARDDALVDTDSIINFERASALYSEMVSREGSGRLPILYRAAQLTGTVLNLDDLFAQLLDLIFEAVPAGRGFVLTLSPGKPEPEIRACHPASDDVAAPRLSQTLIRHVFSDKNAVITMNAQEDERFGDAESVVGEDIRSAMCAPLCGRESLVGAIYVDSRSDAAAFAYE